MSNMKFELKAIEDEDIIVGKVIIPANVTSIHKYVFYDHKDTLKEVIITGPIMNIHESTFSECKHLETVVLPKTVEYIDNKAFYKCKSLKNINIPYSINRIGTGVFMGCESLETIDIPDDVDFIGGYTFYNCPKLTEECKKSIHDRFGCIFETEFGVNDGEY